MSATIKKACKDVLDASKAISKAGDLHEQVIRDLHADEINWDEMSSALQVQFFRDGKWPTRLAYYNWAVEHKDNFTGEPPKENQANVSVGTNKAAEMRNAAGIALNRFNAFKGKYEGINEETEELIPKVRESKPRQQSLQAGQDAGVVPNPEESKTSPGHVVDKAELYQKTLDLMLLEFEANKDADGVALVQTLAEKVGIQVNA